MIGLPFSASTRVLVQAAIHRAHGLDNLRHHVLHLAFRLRGRHPLQRGGYVALRSGYDLSKILSSRSFSIGFPVAWFIS
jgi:hypothetical protein